MKGEGKGIRYKIYIRKYKGFIPIIQDKFLVEPTELVRLSIKK
jgi:hypothetical protein